MTFRQLIGSIRFYAEWKATLNEGRSPVSDRRPWMCFEAINFLERILTINSKVFEFGSGGSTLFLVSRVKHLVSVEHDPEWYAQISDLLQNTPKERYEYLLMPPYVTDSVCSDYTDPLGYCSSDENYRNSNFRNYCLSIERYPDGHFDLVIIDGRARPSCIYHALRKITPGGYLLLDNSDRDTYTQGKTLLGYWQSRRFFGPVPYTRQFNETTFWQHPMNSK